MRISTLAIAAALASAAALARAQDGAPPNAPSRYTFNRVDDGFLRLDNQSGQVAFCAPRAAGWACQVVPEDRAALEKEIERLQDEVASLKKENAALRPPSQLLPSDKNGDAKIKLPTKEDIERARTLIEDVWRNLMDMIVNIQKDMMRKG